MKNPEKNQRFFNPSLFSKTRKAIFLAEETLKIVLAVIVIGFLIYFLVSLYFANSDEDMKFAEESLNFLTQQMNVKATTVQIYNPEKWSVISWPYGGKIPASCADLSWKNCLCICKTPTVEAIGNYLDNCEDIGDTAICVENAFTVVGGESQLPIVIKNTPVILRIDYDNKRITQG